MRRRECMIAGGWLCGPGGERGLPDWCEGGGCVPTGGVRCLLPMRYRKPTVYLVTRNNAQLAAIGPWRGPNGVSGREVK